jgi:hypothetical protein
MPSTLIFLQVLESSWVREHARVATMGAEALKSVMPDFVRIREVLLAAYGAILSSWPGERGAVHAELGNQSNQLSNDKSFAHFWEQLDE